MGEGFFWHGNGSFQYKRRILSHPRYHKVVVVGVVATCNPRFGDGRSGLFIRLRLVPAVSGPVRHAIR